MSVDPLCGTRRMTVGNFVPYSCLTADELAFMDAQRWAHTCADRTGKSHAVTQQRGMYFVAEDVGGENVVYTTKEQT